MSAHASSKPENPGAQGTHTPSAASAVPLQSSSSGISGALHRSTPAGDTKGRVSSQSPPAAT
jgi:hypothetical protein